MAAELEPLKAPLLSKEETRMGAEWVELLHVTILWSNLWNFRAFIELLRDSVGNVWGFDEDLTSQK